MWIWRPARYGLVIGLAFMLPLVPLPLTEAMGMTDPACEGTPDCNENGVLDSCDVAGGAMDCNNNNVPDTCEADEDCNLNGTRDICDIGSAVSQDCNGNSIPDECEIDAASNAPGGPYFCTANCNPDCDNDGLPDECASGPMLVSQPSANDLWMDESDTDTGYTLADDFVLAHAVGVGSIRIHGYLLYSDFLRPSFTVNVHDNLTQLHDTAAGYIYHDHPGSLVASFVDPPFSVRPTGNALGNTLQEFEFTFHLPQTLYLGPGTYWLEVVETSPAPFNPRFLWSKGLLDPVYSRPDYCKSLGGQQWCPPFSNLFGALMFELLTEEDCNANGSLDTCDIAAGTSQDCPAGGGNAVPDECEPDCDGNGVVDSCQIEAYGGQDCNLNTIPDTCDLADGTSADCNSNGIPDDCEADCNRNGLVDDCEVQAGTADDCNANSLLDECEVPSPPADECENARAICPGITYHGTTEGAPNGEVFYSWTTSHRVVGSVYFDTCESEVPVLLDVFITDSLYPVNYPYTLSSCSNRDQLIGFFGGCQPEIWSVPIEAQTTLVISVRSVGQPGRFSLTLDTESVPTGCAVGAEPAQPYSDCNQNGIPDDCEAGADCDNNGTPDICDLFSGAATDCNANGILDSCDIQAGSPDCNTNGLPDGCELAGSFSTGTLFPAFVGGVLTATYVSPPPATGDVLFSLAMEYGNFDPQDVLTVAVNGVPVAEFFDGQTLWCDSAAGQAVIPAVTFNSLVDGGDAVIDITSTGGACPFATLTMDISYESDCNANAIPDDCDIAGGYAFDIDNNFIPDECEGGPIPGDCDQNDVVDLLDHTCFYDCLSGPGIAADSDCFIFDHDIDSDVDLDDFAAISTILSSGTE